MIFLLALILINEPSAIVYRIPEAHASIEDILPYGTEVSVLHEYEEWAQISYHGWVAKSALLEVEEKNRADLFVDYRGAYLFREADTTGGPFLSLPFETALELVEEISPRWLLVKLQDGQLGYIQRSQITSTKKILTLPEVIAFSQKFLNLKYLWGGTTSFGYDCSGFVQMLYRQMGVTLPRNSRQQAIDPQFISVQEALAGDLVFFRNNEGRVFHVGMMINTTEFIHSATKQDSWITVSRLADYNNTELRRKIA